MTTSAEATRSPIPSVRYIEEVRYDDDGLAKRKVRREIHPVTKLAAARADDLTAVYKAARLRLKAAGHDGPRTRPMMEAMKALHDGYALYRSSNRRTEDDFSSRFVPTICEVSVQVDGKCPTRLVRPELETAEGAVAYGEAPSDAQFEDHHFWVGEAEESYYRHLVLTPLGVSAALLMYGPLTRPILVVKEGGVLGAIHPGNWVGPRLPVQEVEMPFAGIGYPNGPAVAEHAIREDHPAYTATFG